MHEYESISLTVFMHAKAAAQNNLNLFTTSGNHDIRKRFFHHLLGNFCRVLSLTADTVARMHPEKKHIEIGIQAQD